MEYQNLDETARKQAYERVKQLAEAIKKIRKKYYLCFNRISDIDKQRYDQLVLEMQMVANENGLEQSYAQLMSDITTQYDEGFLNGTDTNGIHNGYSMDEIYQMYLKATQLLAEFIIAFKNATDPKVETACMKRAQKIQKYIKKLLVFLEQEYGKLNLIGEKSNLFREKFQKHVGNDACKFFGECYEKTRKSPNVLGNIIAAIKDGANMHSNPDLQDIRA